MEEEYDNDYAENYFDNGEGDDMDDLGGGGGDEGGGKVESVLSMQPLSPLKQQTMISLYAHDMVHVLSAYYCTM